MKRSIISLIIILLTGYTGFTSNVGVQLAQQLASRFFSAHYASFNSAYSGPSTITETIVVSRESQSLYYIFNMSPCGWIAVSGNNTMWPVLAYSFEGRYTGENPAPQYVAWMKQYEDALLYLANHPADASAKISSAWNEILGEGYVQNYKARLLSQVKPMLFSNWDQVIYYNGKCPADAGGPGGHTPAGCVPTAMGQIMNYYRWPVTGSGSYTDNDPSYGALFADFGATTYNWDNMPNSINRPNDAIATLLYHLGISCDLVYGPSGSGMYNHKAAYAFRTFFKYSPQTQYLFRDSTSLRWDSVMVAHLNRGMPLYYAGWSVPDINGHAWVCDGYQDTGYFHFNFGWSGSSNGYFHTANPSPAGYNFKLAQELIINIFPDTVNYTYPVGCQGNNTLLSFDGSLNDGNGPLKPYSTTADCSWLISPQTIQDSVTRLTIGFNYISTNPSDYLNIYDGPTTSSTLLGSFSGDTVPAVINSTDNKILVKFKANGGTPGQGFSLTYSSSLPTWCTGTQIIQGDTADITNGSNGFDYSNKTNCRWRLMRNDTLPLTVYFSRFDTEPIYDNLTIFDLGSGLALDTISGHYDPSSPPDSVTAPSGKMFLIFSTNSSITGKGWEIYYPRKNTGIEESSRKNRLKVFPNPCSDLANLHFTSSLATIAELILSSVDGRQVMSKRIEATAGENTIQLSTTALSSGVYIISIKTINCIQTGQLIISK